MDEFPRSQKSLQRVQFSLRTLLVVTSAVALAVAAFTGAFGAIVQACSLGLVFSLVFFLVALFLLAIEVSILLLIAVTLDKSLSFAQRSCCKTGEWTRRRHCQH